MKVRFAKIWFCFLFAFVPGSYINAQVSFSAIATPAEAAMDEYINFRIIFENASDIQGFTAPSFYPFALAGGPTQEKGINSVNGHVSRYIALSYILKPAKTGKFTIGPARARIAGKLYKSNPVTIVISRQTATAATPFAYRDPSHPEQSQGFKDYILHKGEQVDDKVNRNMQLRLEVDKKTCYVGEPVVAAYKLYTRLKSESKLIRNPSFNGFSVIDLQQEEDGLGYTSEQLNGRQYNVYTIRRSQLYPLQPGTIELEPAELENNLQFIKEEYIRNQPYDIGGLFDDFAMAFPPDAIVNQTVSLNSNPVSILVKPLPEQGKTADFKGAVGNFSLESSLQKDKLSTDEAGMFYVTISGSGNMQLLTAPELAWPAGIEVTDPSVSDQFDNTAVPVSGRKTFSFSFSVDNAGEYTIPPVQFSYFDPRAGQYKILVTKPHSFSVSKGTGNGSLSGKPVTSTGIGFINQIFHHRWWIIVFVAGIIITGLIFWLMNEKRKSALHQPAELKNKNEDAYNELLSISEENRQNPFVQTEKCLSGDDCVDFYAKLNTELKSYLSHKFSIAANDVNSSTVAVMMDKKGISNGTILQLQSLMQEIEWQLYTPFESSHKMNELYQRAQAIIQLINTYGVRNL